MQLNQRELGTVLAALRMWQANVTESENFEELPSAAIPAEFADIALDGGEPLNSVEIDDLCERINTTNTKPLVIVSGGVVDDDSEIDLLDYDNLQEGDTTAEWERLSVRAKAYVRKHDPDLAARFKKEVSR